MMHSLPLFVRIAGQPVIVLGEGEAALAKRRLVDRAGGIVVGEDATDVRLAFVALDDPEDAAARLKARGVLVNVVDRPELCDFTTPSILERGPVLVAVGTGGVSAGLAKALRMRLETILPQSLGQLVQALGDAKARIVKKWPDSQERRKRIDAALAQGSVLDPLREFVPDWLETWLAPNAPSTGLLFSSESEIVLQSDDPDDLTLGEARLLANADLIIHDPAVAPAILTMARADAARCLIGAVLPLVPRSLTVTLRRG